MWECLWRQPRPLQAPAGLSPVPGVAAEHTGPSVVRGPTSIVGHRPRERRWHAGTSAACDTPVDLEGLGGPPAARSGVGQRQVPRGDLVLLTHRARALEPLE